METAILVSGIMLFIVAAYGDVKSHIIPNGLVAMIAVLGLVRLGLTADLNVALYTGAASLAIFIATFLLFWRGIVGGGDAKLMTAAALLVGYHNLVSFLVLMSIAGALISVTMLLTTHQPSSDTPQPKARLVVPYGAAIAAGAIVALIFQTSLIG